MKICIISSGRAGSTSLYNAFKEHLNGDFYVITEPFNEDIERVIPIERDQFNHIKKFENVLIKTLVFQTPPNVEINEYYEWLFNYFDHVILLDRKDKKLQAESYAYLRHTNESDWHYKKKRYNMSKVPKQFLDEVYDGVIRLENKLNEISLKYNHKIYFYEDIFIKKDQEIIDEIFKSVQIEKKNNIIEKWIISDYMKVRVEEPRVKLI
jgi:hypothetical protein